MMNGYFSGGVNILLTIMESKYFVIMASWSKNATPGWKEILCLLSELRSNLQLFKRIRIITLEELWEEANSCRRQRQPSGPHYFR